MDDKFSLLLCRLLQDFEGLEIIEISNQNLSDEFGKKFGFVLADDKKYLKYLYHLDLRGNNRIT